VMPAYENFFDVLCDERFYVWSVRERFFEGKSVDNKVNVVLRVDCDHGHETILPIAEELLDRGLTASVYFLPGTDLFLVDEVREMGFEVGLHSGHASENQGLGRIRMDVKDMGLEGCGMTHHGFLENWYLYRGVDPRELGLGYHDGCSEYCEGHGVYWSPPCEYHLADFMLLNNGWNRVPWYPLWKLRVPRVGETIHVVFHSLFPVEEPGYSRRELLERSLKANVYALKKRVVD